MIKDLLLKRRQSIVSRWVQAIAESYPHETSKFLTSSIDRFANPVGHIITESANQIFDEITGGNDFNKIKSSLVDIIKIRTVQDFTPSGAAGFIFSLKRFIWEEVENEASDKNAFQELLDIEFIIDRTALIAFDLYMEAKEKLCQIRLDELKAVILYKNRNGDIKESK